MKSLKGVIWGTVLGLSLTAALAWAQDQTQQPPDQQQDQQQVQAPDSQAAQQPPAPQPPPEAQTPPPPRVNRPRLNHHSHSWVNNPAPKRTRRAVWLVCNTRRARFRFSRRGRAIGWRER